MTLTIGALRMFNTYSLHGVFEGRESRLDDLILEHLALQQELKKLNTLETLLVMLVAEGFTQKDIAAVLGCSCKAVRNKMQQIRWSLYGMEAEPWS